MFAKTVTFLLWRLFSESVCQNLKTRTRHVLCGQARWGEIGGVCLHRRGFRAHGFGETNATQTQMSCEHLAIEKILLKGFVKAWACHASCECQSCQQVNVWMIVHPVPRMQRPVNFVTGRFCWAKCQECVKLPQMCMLGGFSFRKSRG